MENQPLCHVCTKFIRTFLVTAHIKYEKKRDRDRQIERKNAPTTIATTNQCPAHIQSLTSQHT